MTKLPPNKTIIGSLLALIFLGFYIFSWSWMILDLAQVPVDNFKTPSTEGFFNLATTSAGIASALAVGVLGAAVGSGGINFKSLFSPNSPDKISDKIIAWFTLIYLISWITIGTLTVFYGWIKDIPMAPTGWGDEKKEDFQKIYDYVSCLLYTSPSPRDKRQSRMPSSA